MARSIKKSDFLHHGQLHNEKQSDIQVLDKPEFTIQYGRPLYQHSVKALHRAVKQPPESVSVSSHRRHGAASACARVVSVLSHANLHVLCRYQLANDANNITGRVHLAFPTC